jgi:hypothetical protein
MAWGYVAVGAGTLIGGYLSSQGSKNAANTQAQAGQNAINSQQQMLSSQQAIQQPYVSAGQTALQQLVQGTQPGGQFTKQFAMKDLPTATPYVASESQAQQFATKEALSAMQSQMAVGGQGLSSNAIVGAGKLAGDIGSQYENQGYNQWLQSNQLNFNQALAGQQQAQSVFQMNQNNAINPLQNIASMGQASASGQAANVGNAGTNISNLQTGIGNAQAAGQVGSANALGGAASSVGQYMMLQNLMSPSTSGSTGSGVGSSAYSDAAAGMYASGGASDPRLKKNITLIGKTVHDLNLYTFNYIWDDSKTYRGVMSDEVEKVMPEAVSKHGGFGRVDYGMLGIEMEEV